MTPRILVLVLIASFSASVLGQCPQGDVYGQIVDLFGEPLAKTRVVVEFSDSDGMYETVTDGRGCFALKIQSKGRFVITASMAGFHQGKAEASFWGTTSQRLNFGLEPGILGDVPRTVIAGQVSANGKPIGGALIGLFNPFNPSVHKQGFADKKGHYSLIVRAPGIYVAWAVTGPGKLSTKSIIVPASTSPNNLRLHLP